MSNQKAIDQELVDRYWGCFGHLDTGPGEILEADDIVGSMAFTRQEAERVVIILEGSSDSSD